MSKTQWKCALVTGASSGIGEAFARQLAAAGTDLVVVARRAERLEALAGSLSADHGVDVEVLPADLADPEQLAKVESRLREDGRPVDLLVNNAGFGTQGRFEELPLDRQDAEIRVNVLAPMRLTHAALPGMLERKRGGIINVSSLSGLLPLPYWSTYAATKSFLNTFGLALHEEVRSRGVTVLTLLPGFTHSEFHDQPHTKLSPVPSSAWMTSDAVARAGLAAVARGSAKGYPGIRNRLLSLICRLSPERVAARVVAEVGRRI